MNTPDRPPDGVDPRPGPAAEIGPTGSGFSQSALDLLEVSIGRDGMAEVIGQLRADSPKMVGGLLAAARNADAKAMQHFAHMMKSNAKLLGAEALSVRCREVERMASAGEVEPAAALATTVAAQFEAMVNELARIRA